MRVLLIKTSSMGDIIHTLPALSDAKLAIPNIQFDWVVEEPFVELASWHSAINHVIPMALRKWRKNLFHLETYQSWKLLRKRLNEKRYDLILDAQGLVKSALLTLLTKGVRAGLDFRSAREAFASFAYQRKYTVNFYQHAVIRMRSLFSQALAYPFPNTPPAFQLDFLQHQTSNERYIVFLHGTTWPSKQWPEAYWVALAQLAELAGYRIKISGGDQNEMARAERIAQSCKNMDVLPYLNISKMATLLAGAKAAIAVDTGFGHLAAALGIPTVSVYGSTNPEYTGALGHSSIHVAAQFSCAPCYNRQCHYKGMTSVTPACYEAITPTKVWHEVVSLCHDVNQRLDGLQKY